MSSNLQGKKFFKFKSHVLIKVETEFLGFRFNNEITNKSKKQFLPQKLSKVNVMPGLTFMLNQEVEMLARFNTHRGISIYDT